MPKLKKAKKRRRKKGVSQLVFCIRCRKRLRLWRLEEHYESPECDGLRLEYQLYERGWFRLGNSVHGPWLVAEGLGEWHPTTIEWIGHAASKETGTHRSSTETEIWVPKQVYDIMRLHRLRSQPRKKFRHYFKILLRGGLLYEVAQDDWDYFKALVEGNEELSNYDDGESFYEHEA